MWLDLSVGGGSQDNDNYGNRNPDEKKRRNNQSMIPMTIKKVEDDCVYDSEQSAYIYNGYKLELGKYTIWNQRM